MWNKLNSSMMVCQLAFGLSFYGVMAILTRFFLEDLNYTEAETMMIVGAFSSIGPLFAIAGGFIADKFLGAYRSLSFAFLIFAAGFGLLAFGASTKSIPFTLIGIALSSYARGLMSPSYPSLFKRSFTSKEDFENAYPINYSANNIGALLGQYFVPLLIIVIGFKGGFVLSSAIASIGLVILILLRKDFQSVGAKIDQSPVSIKNWVAFIAISSAMIGLVFFMFANMDIGKNIVYAIGLAAILYFIFLMFKANASDALRMGTILLMFVLTTAFFIYYGQMMTSMTIVTINTMRGDVFGLIPIAPEAAMAMNPLWCMLAGPVIAWVFPALEKRKVHLSTASKVSLAFGLTTIAFAILTFAAKNIGADVVIRPEMFLLIHFFQAFAEVIVGSMVVAFILSVTPKHIENFSVSLVSVAIALSGILGAAFSAAISLDKGHQITQEIVRTVYGDYFGKLTFWAVIMMGLAFFSSILIRKMLTKANYPSAS